jgi:HEXXH motif-containing protein
VRAYCEALGAADPAAALARHVEQLKRLALAVHWLAGADLTFETPLRARAPLALPGTALSIHGHGGGPIEIAGLAEGRLDVRREGRAERVALRAGETAAGGAVAIRACPIVRTGGCEIRLQPHVFDLPGLMGAAAVLDAGLAFQESRRELVAEALALIERLHPRAFAQLGEHIRVIALKPPGTGGYTNVSHSDLPGAFVASAFAHPYELADVFIHELHHNRLFAVEEMGPILEEEGDGAEERRRYSPWRRDPRPLRGILHAVYVSIPVGWYWLRVSEDAEVGGDLLAYAHDQARRATLQLAIGLEELRRHATFTTFGRPLFAGLERDAAALARAVARAGVPRDPPAMRCRDDGVIEPQRGEDGRPLAVREAVREHRRRYEVAPAAG